jgi:hypothetical protein
MKNKYFKNFLLINVSHFSMEQNQEHLKEDLIQNNCNLQETSSEKSKEISNKIKKCLNSKPCKKICVLSVLVFVLSLLAFLITVCSNDSKNPWCNMPSSPM